MQKKKKKMAGLKEEKYQYLMLGSDGQGEEVLIFNKL